MPSVVISILSDHWIILSLTKSMLPKKIFEIWKKDHSRNWYVPCRVFRQREISEMLCVWRQYWRGAIYFKTGSVECDKSDNIPPITTSPSYLFSGSNNRDKVLIKDRQNKLLHDPKTIRKKLISIDRVVHCPKMSFELLKNKYTQYLYHFKVWQIRWYFRF